MSGEALNWQLHGLNYAGLAWGDPTHPPLLALHGWLDNATSFERLAEQLASGYYVVAPDLSGHGLSDWRSADATYHIYDDVPQLHALVEHMQWDSFTLMGHSRGAAISVMYAAAFPEQITRLILLDGATPTPLDASEFAHQLRNFVLEKRRLQGRQTRVYSDREAAITAREEQGLDREEAELIASRNLHACEGGYTWHTDPRLRGGSAIKLTWGHIEAALGALSMPTLLLQAERGMMTRHEGYSEKIRAMIPRPTLAQFPGGHHFHMEAGAEHLGTEIIRFSTEEGANA
ncbi:hypothetical protein A3709_09410 [Halioglobus sp. HI00S01]|uniref:alpha/beta fold hydrolase n=1 Tax=Halioglobus sp. HI00S01 TaxID=1822214 RepID=UPI0007C2DA98|nr:alpha/beta hydrolase [Halioglobus sp. HI00S01]KZX53343.1 hypothetical protein A3709_09410 [Halioglobus sp. HI00S01]